MWNYTLDDTVNTASFTRDTGGGDEEIARKQSGDTILRPGFPSDRFSADFLRCLPLWIHLYTYYMYVNMYLYVSISVYVYIDV